MAGWLAGWLAWLHGLCSLLGWLRLMHLNGISVPVCVCAGWLATAH